MEIKVRNVNGAVARGVSVFRDPANFRRNAPRGAAALEVTEPVITTYDTPCERVLFHTERDANPFFHLFESLWMLAGRRDVKFVADLVKRMETFSDDGTRMQGSYGFRWRKHFGFDQLHIIIEHLLEDPSSRRAVLAMWDPELDLQGKVLEGLGLERRVGGLRSKDIPCNSVIYFKVHGRKLHMTVSNRSNDMVWGAYGANAVHMSILQEYIADKIGCEVGPYVQVSDSFHVYTSGPGGDVWKRLRDAPPTAFLDRYVIDCSPFPLGADSPAWDADMGAFFTAYDEDLHLEPRDFTTSFWGDVVLPLWNAWLMRSDPAMALPHLRKCAATDWRFVCMAWMLKHGGK